MLNSKQRALLKSIAAKQDACCIVGKEGLSENSLMSITTAIMGRELIKVSVQPTVDVVIKDFANELAQKLKADIVEVVGRKIILYKYSHTAKKHIDISVSNK